MRHIWVASWAHPSKNLILQKLNHGGNFHGIAEFPVMNKKYGSKGSAIPGNYFEKIIDIDYKNYRKL
jgi:hypothetical protein